MATSNIRRFAFVSLLLASGSARAATIVADDFSADTGRWTYVGTAARDPSGHVRLTDAVPWSLGQIWLDTGTDRPFKATFKYLAGGSPDALADGLVLMFYKDRNYVPDMGGWLGFSGYPADGPSFVPGYGVEIDDYVNDWDPAGPHVALVEGSASNQLAYALDPRAADGQWHTVQVFVERSNVTVSVDGAVVFTWSGTIDRTFSGLGFSGATAAAWTNHYIDDVVIEDFAVAEDDFSVESGRWSYVGAATRDPAGHVVLTDAVPWSLGQLWLDAGTDRPFKASFDYLAGGSPGDLADGLVLMFYKDRNYVPDMGGWLGFSEYPADGPSFVPGYGVEIDDYVNEWDPAGPHVGLVEGSASNQLAYALEPRAADGQWHRVEALVEASAVTVSIDGAPVFAWSGALDRTFAGLGFSGATAAAWTNHYIDDVLVEEIALPVDFLVANPVSTSAAVVSVSVLGGATLNVRALDLVSLRLEGMRVKDPTKPGALGDVNGDGIEDVTLHFDNKGRLLKVGDLRAQLSGQRVDGSVLFGFGELVVVP